MAAPGLYFHSPCFDGIASAVVVWDFLDSHEGSAEPTLHAVNYDRRGGWLAGRLGARATVVDFLYHPDADFWADHHLTPFLDAAARDHFTRRADPYLIYDPAADSCAGLLWRRLDAMFGHRNVGYGELVAWAEKIDAARYDSVDEAITAGAPALRLTLGLAGGDGAGYSEWLVRALRGAALDDVANLPEPRARYARARALADVGLDRFKRSAHLEEDGIVVFDVDSTDAIVSRYAPYYFFPTARYSAGIVRGEAGAKVTAMRNPWRDFESVPLGCIAEAMGGGGRERVGSVSLAGEDSSRATIVLRGFLEQIRWLDGSGQASRQP